MNKEVIKSIREKGKETELFPILQKLFISKGYNDVEITHGKDEYGKDIVFKEYDIRLKKHRWFAVVVKNKNAEMQDFEDGGEISRQINLSFQYPFKDSDGNENYISQVIVVINGTIGTQSKEIISKVLRPQYQNNVELWNYQKFEQEVEIIKEVDSPFNKQTKILFDVLTLNKDFVEIKKTFIFSYIYSFLYANPNSNEDEIFKYINSQLNNSNKDYIVKALNDLRMRKNILSPQNNKKLYYLSDGKKSEIDLIYSDINSKESELKRIIDDFLNNNKIDIDSSELIDLLYKLYQENYTIDIEEMKSTNNSFSASLKNTFTDLICYFRSKKIKEENAKSYSNELIKLCDENDFLNKLSAVHLFNNLYSSDKLEKYINDKKIKIVLDTQILIRLVCVLYDKDYDFSDMALQSIKILHSTLENYNNKVEIYSTYDYLEEVANHLLDAIKLQKFLKLPFVSELGKSKNVFYNFYLELKKNDKIDNSDSFLEFVDNLLNEELNYSTNKDFVEQTIRALADLLEMYDISFIQHQSYPDFQEIKKEYEINLFDQKKDRANKAIENDLRTILYLSTIENSYGEPFLITWDSVFYSFRKPLLAKHPEFAFWYIYSPLKVVDRLSVMNFNLNPKSINLNIISLTETNYNYTTKTTSFLDVLSQFFGNENINNNFIKKLGSLRKNTRDIENINPTFEDFKEDEDGGNITKLLLKIRNRYSSYESKYNFNDVIGMFELPDFEEDIISILSATVSDFSTDKINSMFIDFDKLIECNKKEKHSL